jgi:hypothetical protein
MFRLITSRVALAHQHLDFVRFESIPFLPYTQTAPGMKTERYKTLTDTTRPAISPNLISFIKSSTPTAPGKSFLFARTNNGTLDKAGKASKACNSEVAIGRVFV